VSSAWEQPRLRIRIDGDADGGRVVGPDDVALSAPDPASPAAVREVPATAEARAAGVRRFEVTVDGWTLRATVELEQRASLRERAAQDEEARRHHGPHAVAAPMAGRVVRLWVAEGDTVEAGQRLLAVEAMKMENEIRTPRDGVVEAISVAVGDAVDHGDDLVILR
jgi:biotin carboxyl carrier protein